MTVSKNKIIIDFSHSDSISFSKGELNEWQKDIIDIILEFQSKDSFCIPSSGTTGNSKEIWVKKEHLLTSAKRTNDFFDLKKGDSSLLLMNPKYIGGRMMVIRAIERGLKLSILKPSNDALQFAEEDYDFSAMVPMQVKESIAKYPEVFNRIKHVIIGGGKVDHVLLNSMKNFSTKTYSTFGMTETLSHIAIKELSPAESSSFKLLEGVNIKTENACLIIDSPEIGVSNLKTNDIVEIDERSFKWIGRADNMINSGGVKIFPEQLEEKLKGLISKDFFIGAQKDPKFGEIVVLVVESISHETYDFTDILDKFEIPKKIYAVEKFDRTETGKIKRASTLKKLV